MRPRKNPPRRASGDAAALAGRPRAGRWPEYTDRGRGPGSGQGRGRTRLVLRPPSSMSRSCPTPPTARLSPDVPSARWVEPPEDSENSRPTQAAKQLRPPQGLPQRTPSEPQVSARGQGGRQDAGGSWARREWVILLSIKTNNIMDF